MNSKQETLELRFAYTVSRMLVECVRVIHTDAYLPKHLGASLEEMFVCFAVHIGTAEDRPMSATKIAGFLGVPRTNVLRALAALKRKNVVYNVGNVYLTNVERLGKRITPALIKKQINSVARAYEVLAKLEASILAD
jgi:hypothetical protein